MINNYLVTDVFFDLDHTLWDFEKNSGLAFNKIFIELNLPFSLDVFLRLYNPINHAQWKLYRENKITQEDLRFNRLNKTFEKLNYFASIGLIEKISELYIAYLSTFPHLFEGATELLEALKKGSDYTLLQMVLIRFSSLKLRILGLNLFLNLFLQQKKLVSKNLIQKYLFNH